MKLLRLIDVTRRALPRVVPLMRDRAVPRWLKLAAVVVALLIVSPLDLLGDIPVLGLLDDVVLLALLLDLFVLLGDRLASRVVVGRAGPRIVGPPALPRGS